MSKRIVVLLFFVNVNCLEVQLLNSLEMVFSFRNAVAEYVSEHVA